MKKIVTAVLLICGSFGATKAQDQKNYIQAGVGFGSTYNYGNGVKGMPTLNFTYERMLPYKVGPGTFGAGITVAYRSVKWKDAFPTEDYGDYKQSNMVIALRGAYHLNPEILKVDNLDLYGAVQLGARLYKAKYTKDPVDAPFAKTSDTNAHFAIIAGARYFFTPGFGVYSEVGYDLAWIKLGVVGRF
ncbi:outer membrane beta-barrel protein [Chitinophaga deserti]|uniref:outer membrane beta-barrel protein n=1 Tax=Chitinophaga deserti TaxID=2164099 RepID=UPI000D6D046A|nr:outer membrane beta-barrel protein [Chitinophaga deserti]